MHDPDAGSWQTFLRRGGGTPRDNVRFDLGFDREHYHFVKDESLDKFGQVLFNFEDRFRTGLTKSIDAPILRLDLTWLLNPDGQRRPSLGFSLKGGVGHVQQTHPDDRLL